MKSIKEQSKQSFSSRFTPEKEETSIRDRFNFSVESALRGVSPLSLNSELEYKKNIKSIIFKREGNLMVFRPKTLYSQPFSSQTPLLTEPETTITAEYLAPTRQSTDLTVSSTQILAAISDFKIFLWNVELSLSSLLVNYQEGPATSLSFNDESISNQ